MSDTLERGIAAAKSGDKVLAGQYLQQAINENPNDAMAWLWLSTIVEKPEQKKYCFQKVLAIDPGNAYALKGLRALGENIQKTGTQEAQEKITLEQKPAAELEKQHKRFEYLGSYDAAYTPQDVYEPHMPVVDVYSDMEFFFENARVLGQKAARKGFMPEFLKACPEFEGRVMRAVSDDENQKYVSLITPGRIVWLVPGVMPNSGNKDKPIPEHYLPKHKKHLKITVIGYNKMDAILSLRETSEIRSDEIIEAANRCIPFFGFLLAYAGMLGHSVQVFEGHPSAFEAGVKNSDVLFIDSAMLDFLQKDWGEVAFRVMDPHGKIYVHAREAYKLIPVIRKSTSPGWEFGRGIGEEGSYVHLILTILAEGKMKGKHFQVMTGRPLPDLLKIATHPDQREFISKIPFDYETMDVQRVINRLVELSQPKFLSSTRVYKTTFGEKGQQVEMEFNLEVTKEKDGQTKLDLWLK